MLALLLSIAVAFAGVSPVADADLATMRGGMRLPNGLDLALGIDVQTRVDGQLVLQTLYANEGHDAGLSISTGGNSAYQVVQRSNGADVVVRGTDFEIQHLIGNATGFVVANTGDNRTIDTISSVNVSIGGLPASLMASTLGAQHAALEAALAR